MNGSPARRGLLAGLIGLVLAACGGSTLNDVFVAGIEGTGVVSGFGSIFVNGREFDTSQAQILFNGQPASEAALRVGDVVRVSGIVDGNGRANASRIAFDRLLDGPVESITVENGEGTVTALDQTVRIDQGTRFINVTPETLAVDDLVAVSGVLDGGGVLHATSFERSPKTYMPGSTPIDVEGIVQSLEAGASRFRINGLTVDFSGAAVDETAGPLSEQAFVQAAGTQGDAADAPLLASSVIVRDRAIGQARDRVSLDAVITGFNSVADFQINGQAVDASGARRLDDTGIALAPGVRVQVDGMQSEGQLLADSLRVLPEAGIRLQALLDSVAANEGTLALLGQSAQVLTRTQYLDDSQAALRRFRIGDLGGGDRVSVLGYRNLSGNLIITQLRRLPPSGTAAVRGPADNADASAGRLDIAEVRVETDANTVYRDSQGAQISQAQFFSSLQDRARAVGPENADTIDPATELQLLESN